MTEGASSYGQRQRPFYVGISVLFCIYSCYFSLFSFFKKKFIRCYQIVSCISFSVFVILCYDQIRCGMSDHVCFDVFSI